MNICKEFNHRYEQAGTYHNLGAVAQKEKDFAQALEHYAQAMEIYTEYKDKYHLEMLTGNLTLLFEAWAGPEAGRAVQRLEKPEDVKKQLEMINEKLKSKNGD